jgi:hypothetical protein
LLDDPERQLLDQNLREADITDTARPWQESAFPYQDAAFPDPTTLRT